MASWLVGRGRGEDWLVGWLAGVGGGRRAVGWLAGWLAMVEGFRVGGWLAGWGGHWLAGWLQWRIFADRCAQMYCRDSL